MNFQKCRHLILQLLLKNYFKTWKVLDVNNTNAIRKISLLELTKIRIPEKQFVHQDFSFK